MSDDPDDETPGKPSTADDTQVQIKGDDDQVRIKEEETEEEPEVDKSVREEESKDIYDFFKSHRWLYQLGSDDDFSIIRRSEKQPETIYVYMTIPPDGGWGWVIVVVSFICNATIDGICLTYGRLIPDLTKDMNIDVSKAITISSLMNGMYFLVGPVVSAIANKVGFRPVAMVGGVICAVSVFGGSYCRTWLGLTVCYGFIAGWGFGMVMAPATIIVGYYFEKYRALVTGIAICGSGVGTLIFSPIYGDFVDRYGWRNTLRLQAAFCLLVAILAFLFRPLLPVRVAQIKEPEPGTPSDVESEQSVELDFASYSKFFPTIHPSSHQDNASIRTNATPVIEPNAPIVQHLSELKFIFVSVSPSGR
ncbi:unnamed protein product [Hermetia illucens]|uniref:Major facilitator superfamily (MFS) profile domain-containing protein n=1 Tax=Hermetia illucens TaxID=343691 RepID=A0A7R8YZQ3_HERIL|nr:unnamed protein product [Hermetia illucens]